MKKTGIRKIMCCWLGILILLVSMAVGCAEPNIQEQEDVQEIQDLIEPEEAPTRSQPQNAAVEESGEYTSKHEVAAYLNTFGHLPDNYITKKEARDLGWVSKEGNLSEVAPGKSIGGDVYKNYEKVLPTGGNHKYRECDIDSTGSYRGAKRIIYSDDGRIYYTEDHYETFELLYGEE